MTLKYTSVYEVRLRNYIHSYYNTKVVILLIGGGNNANNLVVFDMLMMFSVSSRFVLKKSKTLSQVEHLHSPSLVLL